MNNLRLQLESSQRELQEARENLEAAEKNAADMASLSKAEGEWKSRLSLLTRMVLHSGSNSGGPTQLRSHTMVVTHSHPFSYSEHLMPFSSLQLELEIE